MNINENIKLGIFDTLHDFWKERKTVKNDEEDDDDEPMDENKQQLLREKIAIFLSKYLGKPDVSSKKKILDANRTVTDILKELSDGKITSPVANYERTVLKYFEETSDLQNGLHKRTTESLRYGDIIDSYIAAKGDPQKNAILQKYIRSNGSNYILHLSCGDHAKYSSFGIIQKNPTWLGYIANFVLNYYYPEITNSKYNAYFTFDAKTGIVGKTFRDIPEVYQLVTPANIADSAVTTFKALNNRNEYFFPENEWMFDSNYYTKDSVQLKFLKSPNGFSIKNQFGFSLQVKTNNVTEQFNFSSSQKQGPSVNYLVDLMLDGERAQPHVNTILNISKIANQRLKSFIDNGLLFDVKRGGDYEQANFAVYSNTKSKATIFSTIDILCCLYARLLKQNTVWHYGEKMVLYRFPSVPIDPAILELNDMKHKSIDLIQEMEILQQILNPNGLANDINAFIEKITAFYNEGIYFDNSRKKGLPTMWSEVITTLLIKLRLIDIMFLLGELHTIIQTFSSPEIQNEVNTLEINTLEEQMNHLKEFSEIDDVKTIPENLINKIKTLLTTYGAIPKITSIMNLLKNTMDLSPNQVKLLYSTENPLGLTYSFFSQETFHKTFYKFNYSGSYQEMKFSNKFYTNLYDALNKFERILHSASSRGRKQLYDKLHKMDYFTFVNHLYATFFSVNIGESVYNALQPQTTDQDCENWFSNVKNVLSNLLNTYQMQFQSKYPSIKLGEPMLELPSVGGMSGYDSLEGDFQKGGGPTDLVQIHELSDLLRLIAGTAAQFVESFITEHFENVPPLDQLITALMNNYQVCKNTSSEILFLLVNGLMSLQNSKDEGFEYVPTATEFELLLALSHTYNSTENEVNYFYINLNKNFYAPFIYALQGRGTGRRSGLNITRVNDISAIYRTATNSNSQMIPAQILHLLVLTLIDNTMQNIQQNPDPKIGYFYSILTQHNVQSMGFDNVASWDKLMDYFHAYLRLFSRSDINPNEYMKQLRTLSGGKPRNKTKKHYKLISKSSHTKRNKE